MFLRLFHAEPSYLGPAAFWPKTHPAQNSNRDPPTMSIFFMFSLPLIPVSPSLFGRTIECLLQRYTAAGSLRPEEKEHRDSSQLESKGELFTARCSRSRRGHTLAIARD